MILILIGALLSILVPVLFYKYILKGTESNHRKLYIKTFLLSATLYTLPIIILEVIWDVFFKGDGPVTIASSFATMFFRAALLEEGVKYYFSYKLLRRYKELDMKEAILLTGLVGVGYGFTEKLVYGGAAMISNAISPGHMLFQWIMGFYLYKALRTEGGERKKLYLTAFFIPFIVHGLWDFGLDITGFLMDMDMIHVQLAGGVLMLAMVIGMLVAVIKWAKKIRRIQ